MSGKPALAMKIGGLRGGGEGGAKSANFRYQ